MGQAEALSRTSERASAPFPVSLRRGEDGMSCLNSIFRMWPHTNFVQWEENAGGRGRE